MTRTATAPTAGDATAVDEHTAPTALTVGRAHELMREHLSCDTATCGARRTALDLLVANGRYVVNPPGPPSQVNARTPAMPLSTPHR